MGRIHSPFGACQVCLAEVFGRPWLVPRRSLARDERTPTPGVLLVVRGGARTNKEFKLASIRFPTNERSHTSHGSATPIQSPRRTRQRRRGPRCVLARGHQRGRMHRPV